ncbi:MAG: ParA family protein [Clostridiales bacterium]|jgi:chromosome partitioning protein|nr:ParA family protein [Clostridiales bacterium]
MTTLAFYNNKGGVGKTTATINIAYALAEIGKHILVIDCDSQRNTSRFFGGGEAAGVIEGIIDRIADKFSDGSPISRTRYPNIDVMLLDDVHILEEKTVRELYDFAVLDLPPAMNEYTSDILRLCDFVLVPIELESFSIQGLSNVSETLSAVGKPFCCFVNKYNKSVKAHEAMFTLARENLGDILLNTPLPYSPAIINSITADKTVAEYWRFSPVLYSLGGLVEEILQNVEKLDKLDKFDELGKAVG